jgi:hypothetical protein
MNLSDIKLEDQIKYINPKSSFYGCIAIIKEISKYTIKLLLISPGENKRMLWGNGSQYGRFTFAEMRDKFEIYKKTPISKEERIINKIKYLDKKWEERKANDRILNRDTVVFYTTISEEDVQPRGSGL